MEKLPPFNAFKYGQLILTNQSLTALFDGTQFLDENQNNIEVNIDNFVSFEVGQEHLQHEQVLSDLKALDRKDIVIVSHAKCPDGVGSLVVALEELGANVTVIDGLYNKSLDQVLGDVVLDDKTVLLCDYSFTPSEMELIIQKCSRMIFLDHHGPAIQKLGVILSHPKVFAPISVLYSGASLTWNFLHPNQEPPLFVRYIEDGDLYTFKMPDARNVIEGLHSVLGTKPFDEQGTLKSLLLDDKYFQDHQGQISSAGAQIVKDRFDRAQQAIDTTMQTITRFGYKYPIVRAEIELINVVGELVCDNMDCPFVMIYHPLNNETVKVSLRAKKGAVNVGKLASEIFKKGGGHVTAASGFMTHEEFSERIFPLVDIPQQPKKDTCSCHSC